MPQSWPDYGDITVTTRESAKYPHHKSLLFYIVEFSKLCALAAVDELILTILRTPLKHLHTWYESNINRHPVSCFLSNNPVILTVSSDQKLCKTLVVKNRCFVFVYLSKFLITYKQHIELCLYVSL